MTRVCPLSGSGFDRDGVQCIYSLFILSAEPTSPARSGVARSAGGASGSELAENRYFWAVCRLDLFFRRAEP